MELRYDPEDITEQGFCWVVEQTWLDDDSKVVLGICRSKAGAKEVADRVALTSQPLVWTGEGGWTAAPSYRNASGRHVQEGGVVIRMERLQP